jgi:hypothetical protein
MRHVYRIQTMKRHGVFTTLLKNVSRPPRHSFVGPRHQRKQRSDFVSDLEVHTASYRLP